MYFSNAVRPNGRVGILLLLERSARYMNAGTCDAEP